ncbi:c-type cytochrome [Nitrosophilus labii]|uniref:c-type cytochrome n=1 Tax=Nitrosophilus labii TaxID=2706014 RepID=UPI00165749C5|nr:c-type cytochrome [Nitrosophilus labii]
MKKKILILFLPFILSGMEGEKIYTKYGCYGCHGIDAKGNSTFPKLIGKSKNYLIERLKGYKNETINSNRADMMKPYAKNLSYKDIELIAEYLSNLKDEKKKKYYEEYDLSDAM